jgi:glyoxylase-like metal-dependent hydrolase (beta-lactamase superfamily II)
MILARYTVGPFAENCYVIGTPPAVAIVDPGAESDRIAADLEAHGWRPEAILLTHGHIDHIAHVGHLCERYGLPVWAPAEDQFLLDSPQIPQLAAMLGARPCPRPERHWQDGVTVTVAGLDLEVIHAPGHTPGHVCQLHRASRNALVGVVIFHRGIGRTDLPGGDTATLERSIRQRLFTLDGDWVLHPGHGPETTLEEEREENPFFGRRATVRLT